VVDAVGVVFAEVVVEFAAEAGVAGVEVAGERGSPAFFEDQPVQCFDVAVGLRPAGADVCDSCFQRGDRLLERLASELVAVVAEDALELPAACLSSRVTRRASFTSRRKRSSAPGAT